MSNPWDNPDVLREHYVEKDLSMHDVADELGTSYTTINRRLDRFGIEKRPQGGPQTGPWQDAGTLRELYVDREMTVQQVADELGCTRRSIYKWLKRHNIPLRWGAFFTTHQGYERFAVTEGWVHIHRLLAVAEYGIESVKGKDVHHRNGIPWDNRPENIEVLGRSEHMKLHKSNGPSNQHQRNVQQPI